MPSVGLLIACGGVGAWVAAQVATQAAASGASDTSGTRLRASIVALAVGSARAVWLLALGAVAGVPVGPAAAAAVLAFSLLAAGAGQASTFCASRPALAAWVIVAAAAHAAAGVGALGVPAFDAWAAGSLLALLAAEGWATFTQRRLVRAPAAPPVHWTLWHAAPPAALWSAAFAVPWMMGGRPVAPWPDALWMPVALAALMLAMAAGAHALDRRDRRRVRRLHRDLRAARASGAGASLVDPLTRLPNAAGFDTWLEGSLADTTTGGATTVLVVGLDGFKRINDAFGQTGGNAALQQVAERLAEAGEQLSRPPSWTIGAVARLAGDEFAVGVQGRMPREDQARLAAALLERVGQRLQIDGGEADIEASIGAATAPADGNASTLLPHAQAALRAAKQAGGATYVFFETRLIEEARDRLDLLRDLRRAVEAKQLELYYQPKIDARSGQVTAAEALLRWHHPTRGLVSPMVFIPLAERFGLIESIGRWVIDDACRQAAVWRKAGLKMRLAVNLSAQQMRQDDIVAQIESALKRHGIAPGRITCEITESVAMEDTQTTQRTFERLGAAGIHVSIDDFGTGYSSLAYLRRLPAAELKIDRAFVKDLAGSADARAIVDAIVKLAHAIGLKVVAEGVETEVQRDVLMHLNCDELQGYLFAKPMTARALLIWAMDDRPAQHAFRPSLFANTSTPSTNV